MDGSRLQKKADNPNCHLQVAWLEAAAAKLFFGLFGPCHDSVSVFEQMLVVCHVEAMLQTVRSWIHLEKCGVGHCRLSLCSVFFLFLYGVSKPCSSTMTLTVCEMLEIALFTKLVS